MIGTKTDSWTSGSALRDASDLIAGSTIPVFIHADGGVGKTVFVESLSASLSQAYEVAVFDCFGGGAYRSLDQERHLPSVGFVQLTNELASRGLCDPLLPGDNEAVALVKAMRRRLIDRAHLHHERLRYGLNGGELSTPGRIGRIPKDSHSRYARRNLLEEFQPFSTKTVFINHKAGNVAARPG